MVIIARSYTITRCLHSSEFTLVDKVVHSTGWLLSVAYDAILSVVRMRRRSLVPKLKTRHWSGSETCTREIAG